MKKKPIIKDRHEKFLYRFEEYSKAVWGGMYGDDDPYVTGYTHHLRLTKIGIAKETEKGYWLDMSGRGYHSAKSIELENFIGQKYEVPVMFVLKGNGKRYAYATIEEAAASFRIRKDRHLAHLERQTIRINTALSLLDKGEEYWDKS